MNPRLIALQALAVVALAVGASIATHAIIGSPAVPSYGILAPPPLPAGASAPACQPGHNHTQGQCLPRLQGLNQSARARSVPAGIRAIDLSNNDPIYGLANWRRIYKLGFRIAEFKVNESTFVDRTAKAMAADAKRAGLIVTGYDFVHLCNGGTGGGITEGNLFANLMKADGLTGPGTLPGDVDVEYGNALCGGRQWLENWYATVKAVLGRPADTYTGDWYWGKNLGSYWHGGPTGGSRAWISGYGVAYPYMPAGRTKLDIWQDYDNYPIPVNGGVRVDSSRWLDGPAALARAVAPAAKPKPRVKVHCFGRHAQPQNKYCLAPVKLVTKTARDIVRLDSRLLKGRCRILLPGVAQPSTVLADGPNVRKPACVKLFRSRSWDRAVVKAAVSKRY